MNSLFCGAIIPSQEDKIVGFHIKAENIPGLIGEITSLLAKYDLNIVHIASSKLKEEDSCDLFVAVDFSEIRTSPMIIARRIKGLSKVLEVKVKRSSLGFLLDEDFFPIEICGTRVICFGHASLKALVFDLRDKFGSGISTILYHLGKRTGEIIFNSHVSPVIGKREKMNVKRSLEILKTLCQGYGWCRIEVLEIAGNQAKVKILSSFEGEILRDEKNLSSELKGCYFIKGILEGILEGVVKREVVSKEVTCISRGEENCVFHITIK
jgi:predicted hydrocarbon binding protein